MTSSELSRAIVLHVLATAEECIEILGPLAREGASQGTPQALERAQTPASAMDDPSTNGEIWRE